MSDKKKFCHTPEGMAAKKLKKETRRNEKARRENLLRAQELAKNEKRRQKRKEKEAA